VAIDQALIKSANSMRFCGTRASQGIGVQWSESSNGVDARAVFYCRLAPSIPSTASMRWRAKRGASPLRLPACRAGQQCVSPPNCRPGPRSSRSGQCFPEAEQGGQGPRLVLSCCCFLSWRVVHLQFENRDVRLVCHQLLGVGDHAPRMPGRACGGSRAWSARICCPVFG
jgi:hypothetical protein